MVKAISVVAPNHFAWSGDGRYNGAPFRWDDARGFLERMLHGELKTVNTDPLDDLVATGALDAKPTSGARHGLY